MFFPGTMFLALSLREAGYSVWANTEASGTATPKLAEDANRRMERAGVHLVSLWLSRTVIRVRGLTPDSDWHVRHCNVSNEGLEKHAWYSGGATVP